MSWQDIAKVVAPTLATGLLGPLGGIVAKVAADALFPDDPAAREKATPETIIHSIANASDPEVIGRLRQAELDVQKFEAANRIQLAQLEQQGVQDARQMRVGALAAGNKTADRLSWVVMISFLVVAALVLIGCGLFVSGKVTITAENGQNWVAVSGLVGAILGYFSANAQQVVGFYFGSSAGSAAKTDQIAANTQTALAALGRSAPAQPTVTRTEVPGGPTTITATGEPSADQVAKGRGALAAEPAEPPEADEAPPRQAPGGRTDLAVLLGELRQPHQRFTGSVSWQLVADGISINGAAPVGTAGDPATVRRVWEWFGDSILRASRQFGVPVELVVATICTESAGGAADRDKAVLAERKEPGFTSYAATPGRVSLGVMQTLISTARETLGMDTISAEDLRNPDVSIRAGTAYIARQKQQTKYDPPLVAAAYNAGSVQEDPAPANMWRLKCYPLGTGAHVTRYVAFFNDAVRVCRDDDWLAGADAPSFALALREPGP